MAFFSKYRREAVALLIGICLAIAVYINLIYGFEAAYTHFFYLPIILAAIWYYEKAIYLALGISLLHIGLGIYSTGSIVPSTLVRAAMFLIVATVLGMLSGARASLYSRARTSEEELRSVFDGVSDAIFIHRLDGSIIEVNDRMLQMFGVTADEAPRLSITRDYSSPKNPLADLSSLWGRAIAGEDLMFEWIARRPHDGSTFPVEVYLRKIRFAGGDVLLATIRDITERKQAEEERSRLAKNMRKLLESTDEGIYGVDSEDLCMFINRSAARMLGYEPEELIGKDPHTLIHNRYPDGTPLSKEQCRIIRSLKNGESARVSDEVFWRSDGTSFPVEYSSNPIRENGGITGAVITFYDITERKRTEKELQDAKRRAELYVDLMGHDINNLNQQGIGYLEIALGYLEPDDEGGIIMLRALEAMKSSSTLIQNVRKIQQIQAGGQPHEIVDLGELLAGLAAEFARVPGREIRVEYEPIPACCIEASALIREAFWNLLSNAVKHSEGPITIWLKLSATEVEGKPFFKVTVEDNGPGIPDELKQKLFTRKVRGATRASGSGLGLFLVKALVDDAGGKVWVEDRVPGDCTKGSRFVVLLPARPPAG